MIQIGDTVPDVPLMLAQGGAARLSDYAAGWLVLYFYPKDSTPGCTTEGLDFNALLPKFRQLGAQVLGVSRDSVRSHQNFCNKQGFAFDLQAVCAGFVYALTTANALMLAGQALTVQDAIGDRLALGIGLAHKSSVEGTLKIPFATPAKHMAEYLDVLLPVLHDRKVSASGDVWSAEVEGLGGAPAPAPRVLLAAMGPRMLRLAGGRTDGAILWLSGPKAVAAQIKPALDAAAAEAGRPAPRIVASVPVCVTKDPARVRGVIAAVLAGYNDLPSYRGVMDTEGAGGPEDVSIVGDAEEVRAGLAAFAAAGATDFAALEFFTDPDEAAATRALLTELASAS